MNTEDLRGYARVSRSIWGDIQQSVAIGEDTLAHVSLLNLAPELTIERAAKVMIERAENAPHARQTVGHPFFRLTPTERFLLTALHLEHWPYYRIARALRVDPQWIQTWAWAVRMQYAFQELELNADYPTGPSHLGRNCPDYDASQPWTQRFLDDEIEPRERQFLTQHLMACDSCQHTLDTARKIYFKIEAQLPIQDNPPEFERFTERLMQLWKMGESTLSPIQITFSESLFRFFQRKEGRFYGTLLFCLMMYVLARSLFS